MSLKRFVSKSISGKKKAAGQTSFHQSFPQYPVLPFLADQLLELIAKHNIDISLLELEVTETAEVDNQLVFSQALEN